MFSKRISSFLVHPQRRYFFSIAKRIIEMSEKNSKNVEFKPSEPKLAATVLICREIEHQRDGFDYEILFVKRREAARFMPGYHVFPGGITETSDELPEKHPLLPSPLPNVLKEQRMRTLRFAAAREVFEESNVLLCDPIVPQELLEKWRPIVLKDCSQFSNMCMELQCKPIWDTLFEWARWITPEQERYRYDTYFYMIPIKKSRQLDASHDEKEVTSHDWITPKEALQQYEQGKIKLAPPTWVMIAELVSYPSLDSLISVGRNGRDMTPVMPRFSMGDNNIVLSLPGDKDSDNPVSNDFLRRLIIVPGESFKFVSSTPQAKPWDSISNKSKL